MKKFLRLLFILLLLGLWFLYIVKNPNVWISQKILKAIGLERLLISDEEIAMGTWTFTLDEIGATFTLPVGREMQTPPANVWSGTTFMISTPEQDNKKYQIFIRGSLDQNMDSLENIAKTYNTTLVTGQTFAIACDGISPSACLGVYENGNVYVIWFSATSQQPQASDVPSTFVVPRYAQVKNAIDAMIKSIVVVPPVMTGNELTGEIMTGSDVLSNMKPGKNILQSLGKTINAWMYTINLIEWTTKDKLEIILNGTDKKYVDLPYDKTCEGWDTWPCAKFSEFTYSNDRYIFFTYIAYNEAWLSSLDLDDLRMDSLFQVTDDKIFDTTTNGDQFFIGNSQSFDPTFRITHRNDISKNKEIWTFKVYWYYDDGSYLYLHTDDGEYQSTKKFLRKINLNTLEIQTTELQ